MKKNKAAVSYKEGLLQDLQDPEVAAAYLTAAIEDGSQEVLMLALRDVAEARGVTAVARKAALNRENLYRILSKKGNPLFSSLKSLLNALGMQNSVHPRKAA